MSDKNPGPELCDSCPTLAALNLAEEKLSDHESFHISRAQRSQALGRIAMIRESTVKLRNQINCSGPEKNLYQQLVCPVDSAGNNVEAFMRGPNHIESYDYKKFAGIEEDDEKESGQYL